ncbi:hypothetical protein, partial [Helicobacter sp. 11S02596-1]|uniref:hypothetical protein n=1 Tax=Helicobacter sp. 11S02596-1 TaxID=1476194 RepID=UPI0015E028A4
RIYRIQEFEVTACFLVCILMSNSDKVKLSNVYKSKHLEGENPLTRPQCNAGLNGVDSFFVSDSKPAKPIKTG